MRLAVIAAGFLFASASLVPASPLNAISSEPNHTPILLAQTAQKDQKAAPQKAMPPAAQKKEETVTQKAKRTWRRLTTPSHSFCVRCPIPIPLSSKTCTAQGKTAEEARNVCVRQNPLCYVSAGKC